MTTNLSMVEDQSLLTEMARPTRQLVTLAKAHVMASGVPLKLDGQQEATRFFKLKDAKRWTLLWSTQLPTLWELLRVLQDIGRVCWLFIRPF
jgi:hypothetical protein